MKILIIGQTTLQWGRMEFGNIGNYYIIEPFVRMLHKVFPSAIIKTTLQLSDRFCNDEQIEVLPMCYYYCWDRDKELAEKELNIALEYQKTGLLRQKTEFISVVSDSDLVIDLSGDIWGDNADFLGNDRFYVGLCKNRVAQILSKKTVMLAGSPGPFNNKKNIDFAKEVYENFDLVSNREPISREILIKYDFNLKRTIDSACPSFTFEPASDENISSIPEINELMTSSRKKIGFILCGWNFRKGPFNKWPRPDSDYYVFAEAIESFLFEYDVDMYLMSHSNGFPIPPRPFKLNHGRDYPIIKQLQKILHKRGLEDRIISLDGVYDAWQTKAIIGKFDCLVSGRVHGAIAGLSQNIPTVIIDYGHEPKAHKLLGFAQLTNSIEYIANPNLEGDILNKMKKCFANRNSISKELTMTIGEIKKLALNQFLKVKELFE